MQTLPINSETVFLHHLEAFGNNDINELMSDYTEESELWTPDGAIVGLEAIASFFSSTFTLFPKGKTHFEVKKMIVKDDKVFLVWIADSPMINVPFATDSFEIKEGKILWQSTAFQMVAK